MTEKDRGNVGTRSRSEFGEWHSDSQEWRSEFQEWRSDSQKWRSEFEEWRDHIDSMLAKQTRIHLVALACMALVAWAIRLVPLIL